MQAVPSLLRCPVFSSISRPASVLLGSKRKIVSLMTNLTRPIRTVAVATLFAVAMLVLSLPTLTVAQRGPESDRAKTKRDAGDASPKTRGKTVDKSTDRTSDKPTDKATRKPTDKSTSKPSDRKSSSQGHGSRFSKYRLTPDEVKHVVELVEKDDPALANKLRRVMSMAGRRPLANPPSQTQPKKTLPVLKDDQVRAAIEIFRDRDPRLGERMEAGFKENPDRVRRMLAAQWGRIERMIALKKSDPSLYKAQTKEIQASYKMYQLVGEIRKAKDGQDTTKLRENLRRYVASHLESRHRVRKLELERLKQRVAKLQKQVEDNEAKMEKAVDARVKDLIKSRSHGNKTKTVKSDGK